MARNRSIHIGINDVDHDQYMEHAPDLLFGCENDALAMMALAKDVGFHARSLLTADATSTAILGALREQAELLDDGDQFFLSYAGHGGTWPDADSDEEDKQDETWCLYDRQLFDDEIRASLARFRPGVRILFVSDSCHSGTVTRGAPPPGAPRRRGVPRRKTIADVERRPELYRAALDAARAELATASEQRAALVLLAACQDDESALEEPSGHGRFTNAIVETWAGGAFDGDVTAFFDAVRGGIRDQTPNLVYSGLDVDAYLRHRPFVGPGSA